MTTLPADTGPTKREIIEQAFEDCGIASGEFGLEGQDVSLALRRLNAMMNEWPWSALGYAGPEVGIGNANESSGIPFDALTAVVGNLALRIAPSQGKTLSPEQRAAASQAMQTMQAQYAAVPLLEWPAGTARGQGARRWPIYPYFPAG